MPRTKSAYSRHRIIDRALNDSRNSYPSLEYLAARCSDLLDTDISPSTVEKDLATMKLAHPRGYDAPIVYSRRYKGYAYSKPGFTISGLNLQDEEWVGLKFAAELLFQYRDVPVFADFRNAIERINARFSLGIGPGDPVISGHVHFEKPVAVSGMEWLHLIYGAIRSGKGLRFSYDNIYKKRSSSYTITPILLKEHRNRWYVIGWEAQRRDHLTFALDRISSAAMVPLPASVRDGFSADEFFRHSVGIMETSSHRPVRVELEISDPICKLVLLEPLHPTQTVVRASDEKVCLHLQVLLNDELYQRLLALGPWCIVKKPATLIKKMTGLVGRMAEQYAIS
jgi:predicted DNA-binding transcriptional regulator YafY